LLYYVQGDEGWIHVGDGMLPDWEQEWEQVKTIGCGRIQRKMSVAREPGEHHLPNGGRIHHIPATLLVPQYQEESLNECVG
jgi:hypothetical protein